MCAESSPSPIADLVEQDSDYARTLGVASILGQSRLRQTLISAGKTEAEAAQALARLTASFPRELPRLEPADAKTFLDTLRAILESYAEFDGAERDALRQAVQVFEQQVGGEAESHGLGGGVAKVVLAVGLSLGLLVSLDKVSGDVDLPGGGHIHIETGIPKGLDPVLDVFRDIMTEAPQMGGEKGAAAPRKPSPSQSVESPTGARAVPRKVSTRVSGGWMRHETALERRDEVLHLARSGQLLRFMDRPNDDKPLFVRTISKHSGDTWGLKLPHNRAVSFAAGVFKVQSDDDGSYRVGLRLQSSRRMTVGARQMAADELDDRFGGGVSVRWTTPPVCLASSPITRTSGWAVTVREGRVAVGCPLSVAGGAIGALGLLLKESATNELYALTAGHTLFDDDGRAAPGIGADGAGKPGGRVFSPPQPLEHDPAHEVGTLTELETFDLLDVMAPRSRAVGRDYGVFRLDPGRVPLPQDLRRVGNRSHGDAPPLVESLLRDKPKMVKAAAKTRESTGRFLQSNMRVEILNPVTGLMVVADDLVEVELDHGFTVERGDSGALVCVDTGGRLEPCGIMVAAARKASLGGGHSRTRAAIYILPLEHISAMEGKEIL